MAVSTHSGNAPEAVSVHLHDLEVAPSYQVERYLQCQPLPGISEDAGQGMNGFVQSDRPQKPGVNISKWNTLWFLTLITFLIIATIGGGIFGGLASRQNNRGECVASSTWVESPNIKDSLTKIPFSNRLMSSAGSAYNSGCSNTPGSTRNDNGALMRSSDYAAPTRSTYSINGTDQAFLLQCNTDYPVEEGLNIEIRDLQWIANDMSSMLHCLAACALYNVQLPIRSNDTLCSGVVYKLSFPHYDSSEGSEVAQCWLKSGLDSASLDNYTATGKVVATAAGILQDPSAVYGHSLNL